MEDNYKDIFKKNFDDHEDDIDPQIIWDNVRPKKKSRFLWFILNSFLVLVVVTALYFMFNIDKEADEVNRAQSSEFAIGEDDGGGKESVNKNKNDAQLVQKNMASIDKIIEADLKESKSNLIEHASSQIPKQTFTEVRKQNEINIKLTNLPTTPRTNNERLLANTNEVKESVQNDDRKNIEKEDLKIIVTNDLIESSNEPITINYLGTLGLNKLLIGDREIPKLTMSISDYVAEQDVVKQKVKLDNKISFSINGGYGFLQANRSANNLGSEQLLNARNNTVEELEAARINMLVNYHLGSKISISSGLQYSRINELFTWTGSQLRQANGQYITEILETPEETFITYEEGEFDQRVVRNMKIYNKTNLVSVPVILNLHHAVGDFSFSIGGGVEANVFQWRDGFVLDPQNNPMSLQDQEQSKFGLNYVAKLGVEYALNEKLKLAVNFDYVQLKQTELNLKSRYNITNLGLGLRYDLGK